MLALYRSGRQAGCARRLPRHASSSSRSSASSPRPRRELERAILPDSSRGRRTARPHRRSGAFEGRPRRRVGSDRLDVLLSVAEPLALSARRELIIARLLEDERELEQEATAANARCASLRAEARTAVFTTLDPAGDVVRLTGTDDEVSYSSTVRWVSTPIGYPTRSVPCSNVRRRTSACSPREGERKSRAPEYSCRSAAASTTGPRSSLAHGSHLRAEPRCDCSERRRMHNAVGATRAGCSPMRRSRCSASSASTLAPCLPSRRRMASSLRSRTRHSSLLESRRAGAARGSARRAGRSSGGPSPVLLVHRGLRPGGLAPRESRTRFSWSIES